VNANEWLEEYAARLGTDPPAPEEFAAILELAGGYLARRAIGAAAGRGARDRQGDGGGGVMDVRVMLFAQLRERAGAREVTLDLPAGAHLGDALEALSEIIGGIPVVMAVNRVYVRDDPMLSPGDELALIPPVSGGLES
jgi:molybdopterin converting factor subunit 1